ncbi:uncharacterized protein MELLADRAFT_106861 [Melampsora larici-populina 98AG31]|uniref:Uncharacterized protein n=1 Tax=Melampsora larici-populina (strain 98AG31 / pathotype 3-4-7) TaxID=747676 RepID=F4RMW2_MELLP|nr:uncharacterized protein MELLADRAFT_106861 [Melampsora larici-populina 98AG31]EGG06183.1 hypothetical protein MELLADRAFT_106861 [Melampsora larici-populina 98AG31]
MIPPRLASYLQQLITQKLLESSTFHELVHKTDTFARSIRQAAIDVVRDNERSPEANEFKPEQPSPAKSSRPSPQSSTTWKSTTSRSSQTSKTDTSARKESNRNPEIDARLETDRKFKEMLQKLRDQKSSDP